MKLSMLLISILPLLALVIAPEPHRPLPRAEAATFTVDTLIDESDGDFSPGDLSLREALQEASSVAGPDIINIDSGIAGGTILLNSTLAISDSDDITINGDGIVLDGNSSIGIMSKSGSGAITINNVTFQNGSSVSFAGAIYSESGGTVTVNNSTFTGNYATGGGAIGVQLNGSVIVNNSTFSGNSATGGGAIYARDNGTVIVNNSTFTGNSATSGGAIGAQLNGSVIVSSSTFSGNSAVGGDNLYDNASTILSVSSSLIVDGDCYGTVTDGGYNLRFNASGCPGPASDPQLGPLQDNGGFTDTMLPAITGPAVDAYSGPCKTAFDQRGLSRPQGLLCDIGATEQDGRLSLVVDILADENDGNFSAGDLSLREALELANGSSSADEINVDSGIAGGTVSLTLGELTVSHDVTINGSGITLDGNNTIHIMDIPPGESTTIIINDMTFLNGNGFIGGAIFNTAILTINNSTFTGNQAILNGGAIDNSGGILTINNSTFSENQSAYGGAIYVVGTVEINNSTFTGNQADYGGALVNPVGTLTINSSTFSGNTAATNGDTINNSNVATISDSLMVDGDCSGTISDGGNNLAYNAAGCPGTVANPQLGPLQDNGGPTHTMLPALVGPAVDAYAAPCVTVSDQRGVSRPQGPLCDIGATEQAGSTILVASAVCNNENLEVTIYGGDGPFDITTSTGQNTPVNGVGIGTTTINGPEKWDNLTVTETSGDTESINLGQFKCRTDERPVPQWPPHRYRTTNPHPYFAWTAVSFANNYRVFLFDDKVAANRTVDIRENSGGPTNMTLSSTLPDGRLFWRVRGRTNRVWGLWSVRFTLFKDPAPVSVSTPVPTIELNPQSGDSSVPNPAPTFPPPPNSR